MYDVPCVSTGEAPVALIVSHFFPCQSDPYPFRTNERAVRISLGCTVSNATIAGTMIIEMLAD